MKIFKLVSPKPTIKEDYRVFLKNKSNIKLSSISEGFEKE